MESGICYCFRGFDHPAIISAFLLRNRLVVVPSTPPRSRNVSRGRTSRWPFRFLMSCPRASHGTTPLLSADCYSERRGNQELTYDERCQVTGGIVALGKFDALHIGHRELAIQAAKAGVPCLLSFVGMAEVLGWEYRAPIVAKCDRQRVLSTWASFCGDTIPLEFSVEFSGVRHLSPRQFVEKLAKELRVSGIVAGENYRFGYRASGDASELVKLCEEYELSVSIVKSVMDRRQAYVDRSSKPENGRERGQVSSTRVRHALAEGDMLYVTELLGRPHRLVLAMDQSWTISGDRLLLPKAAALNQPPKEGLYQKCTLLVDDSSLESCQVIIGTTSVEVALFDTVASDTWNVFGQCQHLGIEFHGAR